MYVHLINNKAAEIIPEIDRVFPDIPVEGRYSAQFLSECVRVSDDTEVKAYWIYDAERNSFSPQPEPKIENQPES